MRRDNGTPMLCVALRGSMRLDPGPRNGPHGPFDLFELIL